MKNIFKTMVLFFLLTGGHGIQAQNTAVSPVKAVLIQPKFSVYAKGYVEERINEWQKKGEFEKTADWTMRVNEQTRRRKIEELTREAENKFIARLSEKVQFDMELRTYDADHEVYLITDARFGNLLVPVPLQDAPRFKESWKSYKKIPKYFIENDCIALASLVFENAGKSYRYSNQASLHYTVAEVDYHFDPIEINVADNSGTKGQQTISKVNLSVGKSDVDVNIPVDKASNLRTFAIIIANENYQQESNVPFAHHDGEVFKEYCVKTLGIPENNVHFVQDATLNNLRRELAWLKKIGETWKGDAKFIFYYTGHGAPDDQTHDSYLLPVDGYGADISTGYSLNALYRELAASSAQLVSVFLDACFSGTQRTQRSGVVLASKQGERGVAIRAKAGVLQGNMFVLSAATSDETALPYDEKGHGMFTYFLLKKLQATQGNATLGELSDYVGEHVRKTSVLHNYKGQNPMHAVSGNLQEHWRTLKLK